MNSDIGRLHPLWARQSHAEKPAEEQKPSELVYGSAEEFLSSYSPLTSATSTAAPPSGASSGTSTPKHSPAWPGNTSDSTEHRHERLVERPRGPPHESAP
jgi:hypothetical protein